MNRFGKAFLLGCIGVFIAGASNCVGAPKSSPPAPKGPPAFPSAAPAKSPAVPEENTEAPIPESTSQTPGKTVEGAGQPAAPPAARKDTAGRYSVILVRNPFGLNPPPPPEPPAPPPPPEPDIDIYLTGITTLLGQQRVFLKTVDPAKTENKDTYYSLEVGDSKDGLEVVAIDIGAGTVSIKHKDIEKELNLKDDGIKPKAAASTAKLTPAQQKQKAYIDAQKKRQAALAASRKIPPNMTGGASKTVPSPRNRVPATTLPTNTRTPNNFNRSTVRPPTTSNPGLRNVRPNGTQQLPSVNRSIPIPTRPPRTSGPLAPPPPVVDREAQVIRMEVNAMVNPKDMPPLPPTVLTERQ